MIGSVANSNNVMPILDNFLFEVSKGELTVWASDSETTIKGKIQVESDSEGSVAVPHKLLVELLKSFPEQPLTFVAKEGNIMEINSNNGVHSFPYLDGAEFPTPVEIRSEDKITIMGDILASAIQKTIFATGTDDLRPIMTGVFFNFSEKGAVFVATDGHRLVKYQREDIKSEKNYEFIMPKKPLNLLKSILAGTEQQVTIECNESNARFSFEDTEIVCRLIDGKYLNYATAIPAELPNKLVIDRNLLLTSVRRVAILSDRSTHEVMLHMKGNSLKISTQNIDFNNSATETLPSSYHGDDMSLRVNSKFLVEMLGNLSSSEVSLDLSTQDRPAILSPVDGLDQGESVVMIVVPLMKKA